jgi:hypothetical protein
MARKPDKDSYGKQEAKQRFEAALRGSRIVGPNPPKTVIVKRGRPPQEKKIKGPLP